MSRGAFWGLVVLSILVAWFLHGHARAATASSSPQGPQIDSSGNFTPFQGPQVDPVTGNYQPNLYQGPGIDPLTGKYIPLDAQAGGR